MIQINNLHEFLKIHNKKKETMLIYKLEIIELVFYNLYLRCTYFNLDKVLYMFVL